MTSPVSEPDYLVMTLQAFIELQAIKIDTKIGNYASGSAHPEEHLLSLVLSIDPKLVLIEEDSMQNVFDYDLLLLEIQRLAADQHYETQERLITRIVKACAAYAEIISLEITLRKQPVLNDSGSLGVRLCMDRAELNRV
jgi:dihydroneopterin aldolase